MRSCSGGGWGWGGAEERQRDQRAMTQSLNKIEHAGFDGKTEETASQGGYTRHM